jgi:Flp pilus assembly protein TadD
MRYALRLPRIGFTTAWLPVVILASLISCTRPDQDTKTINVTSFIEKGNLNEAATIILKAQIEKPDDAKLLYNLAVIRKLQGKLADAKAIIQKALQLSPHDDLIKLFSAELALEAGDAADAWDRFHTVSESARHQARSQYILGSIYAAMRDWSQAEGCFRATIALEKNHTPAKAALAFVLAMQEKYEDSKKLLAETETVSEQSPQTIRQIAECYLALGDAKKALALASPLTSDATMDAGLWSLIGRCEMILLRFSEAESAFTRALASIHATPWTRVEYAELLFAAKREDEALAQAMEAESLLESAKTPIQDPKLYNLLATLYARRGQMLLAHKNLQKSLQLDPTQTRVREILTRLTSGEPAKTNETPSPHQ